LGIQQTGGSVSGLSTKIAGDWFDIREAVSDLDRLQDILIPDPSAARSEQRKLRLSVEEGAVEYKRGAVLQTFAVLEDANFRTFGPEDYHTIELRFEFLTFLSLVQRQLSDGSLGFRERSDPADDPLPDLEIREIMHDVQQRIRSDGANRRNPHIKNILMQISIYSREVDALKKLVKTAPEEKKPAIVRNFRNTSEGIFAKIRRQYQGLIREERQEVAPAAERLIETVNRKVLAPVFTGQAEGFASLASTVVFARTEADRIREILVSAARRKSETLALVDKEEAAYEQLAPGNARQLSREFAREVGAVLDRILEPVEPHAPGDERE
jgi:hypothetical protein